MAGELKKEKGLIVNSTQGLFTQFGFLKTTVAEIAKAARMGKAVGEVSENI